MPGACCYRKPFSISPIDPLSLHCTVNRGQARGLHITSISILGKEAASRISRRPLPQDGGLCVVQTSCAEAEPRVHGDLRPRRQLSDGLIDEPVLFQHLPVMYALLSGDYCVIIRTRVKGYMYVHLSSSTWVRGLVLGNKRAVTSDASLHGHICGL